MKSFQKVVDVTTQRFQTRVRLFHPHLGDFPLQNVVQDLLKISAHHNQPLEEFDHQFVQKLDNAQHLVYEESTVNVWKDDTLGAASNISVHTQATHQCAHKQHIRTHTSNTSVRTQATHPYTHKQCIIAHTSNTSVHTQATYQFTRI